MKRFVAGALLLAGCSSTYNVNLVSVTMPDLKMTEVAVSTKGTRITFAYTPAQTRRVGVFAPGRDGAFRIRTLDRRASYELLTVDGIAILPERTTVEAGSTLTFTLTFAPIPDDLWEFDVGEGDYDRAAGETSWQFTNVKLR